MQSVLAGGLLTALITSSALAQRIELVGWTFETSLPTTAGPHLAEIGIGIASGFHASGATTYSNPVGNGSGESFSSNNWSIGDYYQVEFSSAGYQSLQISFDQTRSSTGPETFQFSYSLDGSNFTLLGEAYVVPVISWAFAAPDATLESSFSFDLISATVLNNQESVSIRLTASSSPSSTGGTNRIDNFFVTAAAIPEPSHYAALFAGVAGLGVMLRRRTG